MIEAVRPRAVIVHGWNVKRPARSVGALAPHLEALGYEVWCADYGRVVLPISTAMRSRAVGKLLAKRLRDGDLVIAHSNGARVAVEASWAGGDVARFDLVLVNPALDHDTEPGFRARRTLLLYNRHDWATRIARWVPWSSWGDAGARGYVPLEGWPADPTIEAVAAGEGHSPFERDPAAWAAAIDRWRRGDGFSLARRPAA